MIVLQCHPLVRDQCLSNREREKKWKDDNNDAASAACRVDYSLGFFSFSSFTPSRPPHSSLSRRPVACALLSQNVKCFISKQILNDFLELGKFACALAIRYLWLDDDAVAMYNRITSLSFAPRLRRLHFSITISDINKYSDGGGGFNYKTILSSLCRVILQRANCCRPYRPLL